MKPEKKKGNETENEGYLFPQQGVPDRKSL
jgi:hypothetical protein